MKNFLTRILDLIAKLIPLWLYPILMRRDSIGIFYHAVSDEPMEQARHLYPVVPVAQFEEALEYLQNRYQFVSYARIHACRKEGKAFPARAVHLSFDDGFSECFSVVRPLLIERSIPCTFFLSTDWLDNCAMFYRNKISLCIERLRLDPASVSSLEGLTSDISRPDAVIQWLKELRLPDEDIINDACRLLDVDWERFLAEYKPYLTIAQIRQMHAEGFTIGAHTKTHRKLMDLSDAEIEEEIVESCRAIQEITGQEIVPFSFPHSAFGIDRGLLFSIFVRYPFVGLLFDTRGVRKDESFIVNRVWAERPIDSLPRGRARVGGVFPLSQVLYIAYREAWVDGVMEFFRRLRRRE
ncbi:MAG: hypothetical protein FJ010_04935 [Chloroflexi bacterium]|nr:hypothetical protein [Chloroflexota bacterium]